MEQKTEPKKKIYLWITDKEEQWIKDMMSIGDYDNYRHVLLSCLKIGYKHNIREFVRNRKDLTNENEKRKVIENILNKL